MALNILLSQRQLLCYNFPFKRPTNLSYLGILLHRRVENMFSYNSPPRSRHWKVRQLTHYMASLPNQNDFACVMTPFEYWTLTALCTLLYNSSWDLTFTFCNVRDLGISLTETQCEKIYYWLITKFVQFSIGSPVRSFQMCSWDGGTTGREGYSLAHFLELLQTPDHFGLKSRKRFLLLRVRFYNIIMTCPLADTEILLSGMC